MRDVPIREVMISPVITVPVIASLNEVEEKFRAKKVEHLPVTGSDDRLVGLITIRDLFRIVSPHNTEEGYKYDPDSLAGYILEKVMTREPRTLGPEDTLHQAVQLMVKYKYGCVPIVDDEEHVAGILTQIDMLKFLDVFLSH